MIDKDKDMPQVHKENIGKAYGVAVCASVPWDCINYTGTLVTLLKTSIDKSRDPKDNAIILRALQDWNKNAPLFGNGGDKQMQEHNTLIAYVKCREICINVGQLAYKYGTIPKIDFSITRVAQHKEDQHGT